MNTINPSNPSPEGIPLGKSVVKKELKSQQNTFDDTNKV